MAQTRLPSVPGLDFQTSAPLRCANVGDWYTTNCPGLTTNNPASERLHRFFINITQEDLDNSPTPGSVTITIEDAESNSFPDEVRNNPNSVNPNNGQANRDPTRFTLLDPGGALIGQQRIDANTGTPDGTSITLGPVTTPGVYTVTSETGAQPIDGVGGNRLNSDDNSFSIVVPTNDTLIGQFQGTFQFNGLLPGVSDETTDVDLFFLVGPGTTDLFLRNFDLDAPAFDTMVSIEYNAPSASTISTVAGTTSANGVWNNGGDINNGADTINLTAPIDDAGGWRLSLLNYREDNQTAVEVNSDVGRLPLFDAPPQTAGNFTITPDTTLTTTIGTEVCHPFTVTNNFFTTDIVNLALSGTDADYDVELRDSTGTVALTDTDGDGEVDTGILDPGETISLQLCVTPQVGAPIQDVTTITGTSFLDAKVREDFNPGNPDPIPQSVEKTTLIGVSEIGLAKTVSAPTLVSGSLFEFTYTLVVENTGDTTLTDVQVTEDLEDALITSATDSADSFSIQDVVITPGAGFAGTVPAENTGYTGTTAGNTNLFTTGNSFQPGDTATIAITVRVDLTTDGTLIANNTAQASGTGPNGSVDDDSQDGNDVDPDGDGDPTNNDTPTPIQIPFPSIGVAKDVSTPTQVGSTSEFEFDYTIIVTNTGATTLDDVQVVEDLQDALITNPAANNPPLNPADSFSLEDVVITPAAGFAGTPPTENGNYTGTTTGDTNLFTTGNTFDPGDSATITITVRVDLSSDGDLNANNTASATGTPPVGPPVTDDSQDGNDEDPDGDGNPANNNTPTPVSVNLNPSLVVVKRITRVVRGGTDLPVTGIGGFNDQAGDTNDNDLNAAFDAAGNVGQPAGIFQLPTGVELQPGDEVEYSIYFWNNGSLNLSNVQVCDELEPPTRLPIPPVFALQAVDALSAAIDFDDPVGGTIQSRSPVSPLESFCISAPGVFPSGAGNAGGGVVTTGLNVDVNEFGAIRFLVEVP
ncbi:MAG: hypothetical protein AAFX01_03925 [Cyanobacteria bacterium J06638_28]